MVSTQYHYSGGSVSMSITHAETLPAGVSRIRTISRFLSTSVVQANYQRNAACLLITVNGANYWMPAKASLSSDNYSGHNITLVVEFEVPQIGFPATLAARFVCPELEGLSLTATYMFYYLNNAWVPHNLV